MAEAGLHGANVNASFDQRRRVVVPQIVGAMVNASGSAYTLPRHVESGWFHEDRIKTLGALRRVTERMSES